MVWCGVVWCVLEGKRARGEHKEKLAQAADSEARELPGGQLPPAGPSGALLQPSVGRDGEK